MNNEQMERIQYIFIVCSARTKFVRVCVRVFFKRTQKANMVCRVKHFPSIWKCITKQQSEIWAAATAEREREREKSMDTKKLFTISRKSLRAAQTNTCIIVYRRECTHAAYAISFNVRILFWCTLHNLRKRFPGSLVLRSCSCVLNVNF